MKVAVTGATGFIGKYLVKKLTDRGLGVLALGRSKTKLDKTFKQNVSNRETDYSLVSLNEVLRNTDIVVHLAARRMSKNTSPLDLGVFLDDNVKISENLLKAAQSNSIERVCNISSISVYSSRNRTPFKERDKAIPSSVYGISKFVTEKYSALFSSTTGLPVINLRLSQVIGLGERSDLMFMKFLNLARQKQPLPIWGDGKTAFDYIYVKDVVEAIYKVISLDILDGNETYNIGSGKAISVLDMAKVINTIFKNEGNLEMNYSYAEEGTVKYMDCSKAKNNLQWKSRWSMEEAVHDIKKMITKTDL